MTLIYPAIFQTDRMCALDAHVSGRSSHHLTYSSPPHMHTQNTPTQAGHIVLVRENTRCGRRQAGGSADMQALALGLYRENIADML